RPDEPSHLVIALAARNDLRSVGLAGIFDGAHVVRVRTTVDHRAHEVAVVGDVTLWNRLHQIDQLGLHLLPPRLWNVGARSGRTLLALIFEGAADQGCEERTRV